jgi:hypothetical protein
MDAVSFFAVVVFAASWFLMKRADAGEPLVRLFFALLMTLAALIGGLGILLRALA